MPRKLSQLFTTPRRPSDPELPGGPTAMIATATIRPRQLSAKKNDPWQTQAWEYYDFCGELRYSLGWKANALSRARLFIGQVSDDGGPPTPVDKGPAVDALRELFGGPSGQSQMLHTVGIHLGVPGDSYIVGWDSPDTVDLAGPPSPDGQTEQRNWRVLCPDEIEEKSRRVGEDGVEVVELSIKLDGKDYTLPDESIVIRVWDQHARFSWQADSPARGVLPILHELERLTQMIIAQANSRLAGAGVFLVPKEMDFPKPPPPKDDPTIVASGPGAKPAEPGTITVAAPAEAARPEPSIQTLMDKIQDAMVEPVSNREDPNALVPIGLSGPAEVLDKVRHITFWTPLDAAAIELRKEAIRRLALGLDVPPEVVLGMGDTNHWNGWQITQSAITLCIEPLLARICDALTRGYLRPYLGAGADNLVIWFDTAELVQQADRGPAAKDVFELDELSGVALRRENGFSEQDAPNPEERRLRAMRRLLASAGVDAQLTRALLEALGFLAAETVATTPVTAPGALDRMPAARNGVPATPSALDTNTAGSGASSSPPVPRQMTAAADGFSLGIWPRQAEYTGQAKVLAAHALDYAGKRLLKGQPRSMHKSGIDHKKLHETIPVPEEKATWLLDGVWEPMAELAEPALLAAVGLYVHELITAGQPLDVGRLTSLVEQLAQLEALT